MAEHYAVDAVRAKGVITSIRGSWGVDVPVDENVRQILAKYRASLSESLRLLSEELYSTSTHFLLELLQNADDNDYAPTVEPCFEIRLDSATSTLQVINNEKGFKEPNVFAICDSGASTKAKKVGFIGEKGIGFKSVFAVSSDPMVVSGGFQFQFHLTEKDPMGYVVPHWVSPLPDSIKKNCTNIVLPLKRRAVPSIVETLKAIEHPILLFLRNIRVLKVQFVNKEAMSISRTDRDDGLVEIMKLLQTPGREEMQEEKKYKMVELEIPLTESLQRDRGVQIVSHTRITLAFPIGPVHAQQLFAYLPVRDYGFKFVVQADFKLSTTRADIPSSDWNTWLRDHIAECFSQAVDFFQTNDAFKHTFYDFVPLLDEVPEPFFHPVVLGIQNRLSKTACVLTEDGEWCQPRLAFFPAPDNMVALLESDEVFSAIGMKFLSPDILLESRKTIEVLSKLGVQRFTVDKLVELLLNRNYVRCIGSKDPEWFAELFNCLGYYINRRELKVARLQNASILLLQNGKLASPSANPLFLEKSIDSTEGIEEELPILHPFFSNQPATHTFFRLLNIKMAQPSTIITQHILPRLLTMAPERLIAATKYIKSHEEAVTVDQLTKSSFPILAPDMQRYKPQDLLLPSPINPYPVQELLQDRFPFVSTQYLSESPTAEECNEWRAFFLRLGCHLLFHVYRNERGVWTSNTFGAILEPVGMARPLVWQLRIKLCEAMSVLWDYISPYVTPRVGFWKSLCAVRWLPGSDGQFYRPVDGTLFQRTKCTEELLRDSVVYLNAEVGVYCAKALNVKTEATADVVLQRLPTLRCAADVCGEIYGFLHTQWTTHSAQILAAFQTGQLIHYNTQKFGIADVSWTGDPKLVTRTPLLQAVYPTLKEFFVQCLGVSVMPTLPHYIAALVACKVIPAQQLITQKAKIQELYFHINTALLTEEINPDDINPLKEEALFLTNKGIWKKCTEVVVNDKPQNSNALQHHDQVTLWDIPFNFVPKVQAIIAACEMMELSNLKPCGGGPDMETLQHSDELTMQCRHLVPFLLRYTYFEHYEHYRKLTNPAKFLHLHVWKSAELTAEYKVHDHQWTSELDFFVKDDPDECHIFVTANPSRSIPKALAECLGASPLTVQGMLAAQTAESLNQMLVELGVGELPEGELPEADLIDYTKQLKESQEAAAKAKAERAARGEAEPEEDEKPEKKEGDAPAPMEIPPEIQSDLQRAAILQGHQQLQHQRQTELQQTQQFQQQQQQCLVEQQYYQHLYANITKTASPQRADGRTGICAAAQ
eukprot:NODE_8_length_3941_cov_211.635406_g6_i0.p1 GENE.NODE_8_length_3941_cov_211.635406_g6_i0~~NODE_8_length_3941_cov_211.635406_g6_i0.p1  ORF type:complete len:1279 (-),score=358.37 NODE_8_length_3941_cov_211.635406_g6_i0:48-3884(-)